MAVCATWVPGPKFGDRRCRLGIACDNAKCGFAHPGGWEHAATPVSSNPSMAAIAGVQWVAGNKFGDRRCREGANCANAQCGFAHPSNWVHFHGTEDAAHLPPTQPPTRSTAKPEPPIVPQTGGFGGGFADGGVVAGFTGVPPQPLVAAEPCTPAKMSSADPHVLAGTVGECSSTAAIELQGLLEAGLPAGTAKTGGLFDGFTLLHSAAYAGNVRAAEVLLAAGAMVDAANRRGDTPLCVATRRGHKDTIKLLMRAGADPAHANAEGCTAAQEAERKFGRDSCAMEELLALLAIDGHSTLSAGVAGRDGGGVAGGGVAGGGVAGGVNGGVAAPTASQAPSALGLNVAAVEFVPPLTLWNGSWEPSNEVAAEAERYLEEQEGAGMDAEAEAMATMAPDAEEQAWLDAMIAEQQGDAWRESDQPGLDEDEQLWLDEALDVVADQPSG